MAYLGQPPSTLVRDNPVTDTFTGNDTTEFTLSRAVQTGGESALEVFVSNVQQQPTVSYTVNGSTLTFTEAPSAGEPIYVINRDIISAPAFNAPANSIGTTQLATTSVTPGTYGNATSTPIIVVDAKGRLTSASAVAHTVANTNIVGNIIASQITSVANAQLTGNIIASQIQPTGVTSATYGGTTAIPVITIDQQGRVTEASNASLSLNTITGNVSISGNIKAATFQETFANVAISSGNIILDLSTATVFKSVVTSASNIILQNPPPDLTGFSFLIQLSQTGSYAITWPASIQWPSNTAPTLSTTAGYVDTIALYTVDGGTNYYGTSVLGQY